jgi:hypothetical protein
MKCFASREGSNDREDAIFLKDHLQLTDYNQVLDIVEKYIPRHLLSVWTVAFAQGLFHNGYFTKNTFYKILFL